MAVVDFPGRWVSEDTLEAAHYQAIDSVREALDRIEPGMPMRDAVEIMYDALRGCSNEAACGGAAYVLAERMLSQLHSVVGR